MIAAATTRPIGGMRALVTGAGVRLGRAIALRLADGGASVAVHHHVSAAAAADTVASIRERGGSAFAVQADLADADAIGAMFAAVDAEFGGGLDLLVNNAGIFEKIPAEAIGPARWRRMFAVNVDAAFLCSIAARPRLLAAGGGSIVNVTDIAGERPWAGYAHYCASKAALISLTRSLAVEWAPAIRVNGVSPGAVLPPESATAEERERLAAATPMRRLGRPEEVADAVVFLAAGPPFLTGQIVAVDGGRSARL